MNTCNSFAHYIYLRNYGFIKHFIRNIYNASSNFPEFVDIANIKCHEDVYKFSLDQRDTFWGRLARSRLNWYKEFDIVSNCNLKEGKINWFSNGKLNASGTLDVFCVCNKIVLIKAGIFMYLYIHVVLVNRRSSLKQCVEMPRLTDDIVF